MKAKDIRKITNSYNRKKHRKYLIKQYKSIFKCIKKAAKRGEDYVSFSYYMGRFEYVGVAFRLFRLKNGDYKTSIDKSGENIHVLIQW